MFKKHNRRTDDRRRIADRLADIRRTQDACFDDMLNQPVPCPPMHEPGAYPADPPPQPPPDMPHAWTRIPRRKGNAKAKKP